jgi:LysM repeat protein
MTSTTTSPCLRRTVGGGVGLAIAAATITATASPAAAEDYVVQPGDTVSHIAARTGTTVNAIVSANNLDARATIRIGQVLTLPTAAPAPVAAAPAPAATTHTVVAGDTVSALAKRYGSTVQAIVAANGLDSRAFIRVGQTLTIPAAGATVPTQAGPAPAPAPTTATHLVVAGDTVSALAKRYGTTVDAIVSANGLDSRALIRIGQTLTIPGATVPQGTATSVGNTFAGRTYPAHVVAAANENLATLRSIGVPSKDEMRALVRQTAIDMGVDPALALAVAYQESGFNHASVSPANAIGTMQVIPTSGDWASDLVGRRLNLLDPRDNVVAGVAILRQLVRTAPDLPTAIAGYYQGLSSVTRNGMYEDTKRYVANVQSLMSRFA